MEATTTQNRRKQGGLITMTFILANEACDKLAIVGFHGNMLNYLTRQLHMPLTKAANTLYNFGGTASLTPLIGAFIADAFAGRFWTIILASFIYVIGMTSLTLSATLPQLRPPPCKANQHCEEANSLQLGVLYISLLLATVGSGGIRPCVVNFGADQFDETEPDQREKLSKYFNWYYFVMGVSVLVAVTVVIYVQDNIGWGLGLGIPTVLMLLSCLTLAAGYPLYRKTEPAGSPFTRLLQVAVAAFKKRKLKLQDDDLPRLLYENDELDAAISTGGKLLHTSQFKFLDKAAIVGEEENVKGPNMWRISTVHRVEELKSMIRMTPIWASGVLLYTAYGQQGTFSFQQATTMDRHISSSSSFQIPAGSMSVFTMLSMLTTIVFYDRVFVPVARHFTRLDRGITYLHRMAIGFAISIFATLTAGFVEVKRKRVAAAYGVTESANSVVPMSVLWLVPQYSLHGLAEAFISVGQLEFFYGQTPESMRSTATALMWLSGSLGSYVSSFIVTLIHKYTANWLPNDNLNKGKLEYFYWLITALQILNFIYYILCAKFYTLKPLYLRRLSVTDDDQESHPQHIISTHV